MATQGDFKVEIYDIDRNETLRHTKIGTRVYASAKDGAKFGVRVTVTRPEKYFKHLEMDFLRAKCLIDGRDIGYCRIFHSKAMTSITFDYLVDCDRKHSMVFEQPEFIPFDDKTDERANVEANKETQVVTIVVRMESARRIPLVASLTKQAPTPTVGDTKKFYNKPNVCVGSGPLTGNYLGTRSSRLNSCYAELKIWIQAPLTVELLRNQHNAAEAEKAEKEAQTRREKEESDVEDDADDDPNEPELVDPAPKPPVPEIDMTLPESLAPSLASPPHSLVGVKRRLWDSGAAKAGASSSSSSSSSSSKRGKKKGIKAEPDADGDVASVPVVIIDMTQDD